MDSFDEWKFKQNIMVNGLNAKTIADMNTIPTIPWNNSQIHIPAYYGNYRGILPDKYKELIGTKHGRYTVLNISRKEYRDSGRIDWVADCVCECGNERQVRAWNILADKTLSCGCLQKDMSSKTNDYKILGDVTIIYASNGTEFLVDTYILKYIKNICIGSNKKYPRIYCCLSNYPKFSIYLYELLLPAPEGYEVDHINRNPKDNRYSNLRVIPHNENIRNTDTRTNKNIDLPKGVSYSKINKNYIAEIYLKGTTIRKRFKTAEEAISYRKYLEEKYYGYHPLEVEHLILPNGELNPKYPYERYPIEFWRKIGINPFIAYRI